MKGRRFTVSLMMQPIVMARLLGACGGAARKMGFIARNLVAWPTSTIGQRLYVDPPADMSATNKLAARFTELLDMELMTEGPKMALTPTCLSLSPTAKTEWTKFFNEIEVELSRAGEFGNIPDIGSKIAENAVRMAGVFHTVIQGPEGQLDKDAMRGSISVVTWHLSEAIRVIAAQQKSQNIIDAELLLEWLLKQPPTPIDPRTILQFGPSRLRDKKVRDAALKILADKHWVFESGNPTRLTINPRARTAL